MPPWARKVAVSSQVALGDEAHVPAVRRADSRRQTRDAASDDQNVVAAPVQRLAGTDRDVGTRHGSLVSAGS